MKALSFWQPWAELVVIGAKKYETRSWNTNYRGPLLIHASRKFSKDDQELCRHWPFCEFVSVPHLLQRGAIIGSVDLVDCLNTNAWVTHDRVEQAFGNFSRGRFAWKLKNPVRFNKPIAAKGKLGIWEFRDE